MRSLFPLLLAVGILIHSASAHSPSEHAIVAVEGTESAASTASADETARVPADQLRPFIPTDEWQTVERDHALPAGLHVRINMQTGLKEARLMEESVGIHTLSEKRRAKLDIMAPYLAAAGAAEPASPGEALPIHDLSQQVENEWRPVRADSADITLMQHALAALGRAAADGEVLAALEPLQDMLDDLDNAKEFRQMGGLTALLEVLQAARGMDVRSLAARLLGLAAQNNREVQEALMDGGAVATLLRLLTAEGTDRQHTRLLFAVSSLCRSNARGLELFAAEGGVAALLQVALGSDRLLLKSLTLLTDLVIDQVAATTNVSDDLDRPADLSNVAALSSQSALLRAAAQAGWCARIPQLLGTSADAAEKTLEAMLVTMHACQKDFVAVLPTLTSLQQRWRAAPATGEDGESFSHMLLALADEAVRRLQHCEQGSCFA